MYVVQFELLLCVEDEQDPAVEVVQRLQQRYPSVECRLYVGGKQGVINPMVYNMAPAYDAANYDIVWVSTSRIKGIDFICAICAVLMTPQKLTCRPRPSHQLVSYVDKM